MSKFKVGDILRTDSRFVVSDAGSKGGDPERLVVCGVDVDGDPYFTYEPEGTSVGWGGQKYELVVSIAPTEFIINGCSELFTSQEDAENYATHSGMYTDGTIVETAQVTGRFIVRRTVSASLETVE